MKKAFSLIELSVVITIIAIIAGSVISVANTKQDIYKIEQTKNKLDIIEKSLASFVKINGRLPCPAVITKTPSLSNYGDELCGCENQPSSSTFTLDSSFVCSTPTIVGGMIPWQTLSLPKEFGIDGWGNKIQYIVMKGFTANDPSCSYLNPSPYQLNQDDSTLYKDSSSFDNCNKGLISILGPSRSPRADNAVYVLLSHGANGYSAYGENSSTPMSDSPSANVDELSNKNVASISYLQKEPNSNFDDIVRFKLKWQILQEADSNLSNLACIYAKRIKNKADKKLNSNFYCGTQPISSDCESTINILSNIMTERCLGN